jgi:hypothetical protein
MPASAPAAAATIGRRTRSARRKQGEQAHSQDITAAITALTCRPLIESRCVSPASRIASSSVGAMLPRSPLASAAAIEPGDPARRARM